MSVSDLDLVRLAQGGDRRAFQQLLERHYAMLFRLAYRFCGNRADAEDIAQETAVKLGQNIATFHGKSRFSTWAYRIAVNACRDHGRRRASATRLEATFVEVDEGRRADWADSDERTRWLYQAFDGLDPAMKETALLVIAEDMSHAQASEILGVKEATVSWRMHEIKKRLKTMARNGDA
jgi:RNA polymerase sigma-70 factor, ECF subfamily